MKANSFSQRFRRLTNRCVNAGLIEKEKAGERLVSCSTGHTRITELVREGNGSAVVMPEAGPVNPMMTERYIHMGEEQVTEQVRENSAKSRAETPATEG